MVLIDGGLLGSFDEASLAEAQTALAEIAQGKVFDDLLGFGIPEITGILAELAALYARKLPDAASPIQASPLIPPQFKPAFGVTNEGALGFAFDKDTSPEAFSLIRINAGRLATSGNPAPVAGRGDHADPAVRRGLRQRAPQRNRVVFPPPPSPRRGRDEPAQAHRGHPAAGPAAVPRVADQRAAVCLRDRLDERHTSPRARGRSSGGRGSGGRGSTPTSARATSTRWWLRRLATASSRPW